MLAGDSWQSHQSQTDRRVEVRWSAIHRSFRLSAWAGRCHKEQEIEWEEDVMFMMWRCKRENQEPTGCRNAGKQLLLLRWRLLENWVTFSRMGNKEWYSSLLTGQDFILPIYSQLFLLRDKITKQQVGGIIEMNPPHLLQSTVILVWQWKYILRFKKIRREKSWKTLILFLNCELSRQLVNLLIFQKFVPQVCCFYGNI